MNVYVAAILAVVAGFAKALVPTKFGPKSNSIGCRVSSLYASSSSGDGAPSFFEYILPMSRRR